MGKIQYYPKKRITVNEKKYEQELNIRSATNLLNILCPRNDYAAGVFISPAVNVGFSGGGSNDDIYITYEPGVFHGATTNAPSAGLFTINNYDASSAPLFSESQTISFPDWKTNRDYYIDSSEYVAGNGTITFYIVPKYIAEDDSVYVANYIDKTATNLISNNTRVLDRGNLTVTPYLKNEVGDYGEMSAFVKIHFEPDRDYLNDFDGSYSYVAANSLTGNITYDLYGIDANTKITVPISSVAVGVFALYTDGVNYTYATDFQANRAVIGAELLRYSPSNAGETSALPLQTSANVLYDAFKPMVDIVGKARNSISAIPTQLQQSIYNDIIFISSDNASFVSGYTLNSDFPSSAGYRWDK